MRQEQFLDVVTVEEARKRWEAALDFTPRPPEVVALRVAHGRVRADRFRQVSAEHLGSRVDLEQA